MTTSKNTAVNELATLVTFAVLLAFIAFIALMTCGCMRQIAIERDGVKATYTNWGFDTKVGKMDIAWNSNEGTMQVVIENWDGQAQIAKQLTDAMEAGARAAAGLP